MRILQGLSFGRLSIACRTGRQHEYLKAPDSDASNPPAAPAGHTNTAKFPVRAPQHHLSSRQAKIFTLPLLIHH